MILSPSHESCVVLDACVLLPMPLCDTLLRCAEEPSFFRIAWSAQILGEIRRNLIGAKFGYSVAQAERRVGSMQSAFPEAMYSIPPGLIDGMTGMPDPDDRHVLALAVHAHANTIVTENTRHFPVEALAPHGILVSTADEFLTYQYRLDPQVMLEKLDGQAAGIRRQRSDILVFLQKSAPRFCELCSKR
jgi:predicted nucleic acid-binding protein